MERFLKYEEQVFELESQLIGKFSRLHGGEYRFSPEALPTSVRKALVSKFRRHRDRRGLVGVFIDSFMPAFLAYIIRAQTKGNISWMAKRHMSFHEFMRSFPHNEGLKICQRVIKYLNSDLLYIQRTISTPEGQLFLHRWSAH